jgi:hypothetical protein
LPCLLVITGRRIRLAPFDETAESAVEFGAHEHDSSVAASTSKPDIHPDADDLPLIRPARMRLLELNDIAFSDRGNTRAHVPRFAEPAV